jgi:hypothetical protein
MFHELVSSWTLMRPISAPAGFSGPKQLICQNDGHSGTSLSRQRKSGSWGALVDVVQARLTIGLASRGGAMSVVRVLGSGDLARGSPRAACTF